MPDNVKTIKKKDLKPGMFVRKYGQGTFQDPQVQVDRYMKSYEDIAKYLPDDTAEVEILTDKTLPQEKAPLT